MDWPSNWNRKAVDEAREAGIEHFIFVTGRNKEVIENHFDTAYELEDTLQKRGKFQTLEQVIGDQIGAGRSSFTRQQAPLGLGHAVACARDIVARIAEMIEKLAQGLAPSNQIISGRYILQPEIFAALDKVKPGSGGEIQLTDAMIALLQNQDFHAVEYKGKTYDCGDKLGFIMANLAFGLERPELSADLRNGMIHLLNQHMAAKHKDVFDFNDNRKVA